MTLVSYGVNPDEVGLELPREWTGRAATPLTAETAFNGFVCTHVVYALERLGVFARFGEAGPAVGSLLDAPLAFSTVEMFLDLLRSTSGEHLLRIQKCLSFLLRH